MDAFRVITIEILYFERLYLDLFLELLLLKEITLQFRLKEEGLLTKEKL